MSLQRIVLSELLRIVLRWLAWHCRFLDIVSQLHGPSKGLHSIKMGQQPSSSPELLDWAFDYVGAIGALNIDHQRGSGC